MNLLSFSLIGPQPLVLSGRIVPDHRVRRIQNRLRGAVILLQLDHLRLRKYLFKIQDIADIRPSELINRLIVVADHAEISVLLRQEPYQLKLSRIGVLIFIHADITKTLLIAVEHIRIHPEQLHRFHDQIVKIQRIVLFQRILILPVSLRHPPFGKISHGIQIVFLRGNEFVLRGGYLRKKRPLLIDLRIDIQALADFLHHAFGVIRIIYGKIGIVPKSVDISPQYPHARGMEGGDPDAFRSESHDGIHPLPHFLRRLVREGNRKDIPWIHLSLFNQVRNSLCQHARFSASCARQDQYRPLGLKHRFPLSVIQHIQIYHFLFSVS